MNTGGEHTVKAFDEDIARLRGLISEMGGLAEQAITLATDALVRKDLESARRVIESDKKIDTLEIEVETLATQIIALRAPMADDLREMVAAIKMGGVIERMGDYAKNIAKRVPMMLDRGQMDPLTLIPAMSELVVDLVRMSLDSFAARDPQLALKVADEDRKVDGFYNSIFRALVAHMMENPKTISVAAHLLFVAKNLERIGDHATNVAEMVYYAATGDRMPEREKGPDPSAGEEG